MDLILPQRREGYAKYARINKDIGGFNRYYLCENFIHGTVSDRSLHGFRSIQPLGVVIFSWDVLLVTIIESLRDYGRTLCLCILALVPHLLVYPFFRLSVCPFFNY